MEIVKPSAELLSVTPDAEKLIELAGRTCYQSEGKITDGSAERFVCMLMGRHHESVLEHAVATIKFVCDRGVSHELVRHRLMSPSQESTRFCRYKNGIQVIEPPGMSEVVRTAWSQAMHAAEATYLAMLDGGVKPEIARSVLPTCVKTSIVVTANFREWRWILKLRLSKAAHPQIREIMRMAFDILHGVAPTVFPTEEFLKEA